MSVLSDFATTFTEALARGEDEKQMNHYNDAEPYYDVSVDTLGDGTWVYEGGDSSFNMQLPLVYLRPGEKLEFIHWPTSPSIIHCDYCGSKVTKPNCTQCGAPTRSEK